MTSTPILTRVRVADISTENRLRPASDAGVAAIVASINEIGRMISAPEVRRKKDGSLHLIAGGHRLAAAKSLGWEEIEVRLWDGITDDLARLIEVDDNLAGAEMNPLDTAVFLAERKRLYEKMHPETKAATGAALVAKRWDTADTMSVVSFVNATAEKFGVSDRHIRRLVAAGEILGAEAGRLRYAPQQLTLKDLMDLSKLRDGRERAAVIDGLVNGAFKTASRAIAAHRAGPVEAGEAEPVSANDQAFARLSEAWSRAPMAVRRRFVAEFADDLEQAGGADGL